MGTAKHKVSMANLPFLYKFELDVFEMSFCERIITSYMHNPDYIDSPNPEHIDPLNPEKYNLLNLKYIYPPEF